ncbi:phospho-sugar glycosidase domain-containing protein [Clostridioides difficile]
MYRSKKKYAKENFPKHDNKNLFKRGDVVIGNNDFGKYKGELQLILQDCTDERKNKVGRIKEDEIILLDFIEPWSKFKIILEGE